MALGRGWFHHTAPPGGVACANSADEVLPFGQASVAVGCGVVVLHANTWVVVARIIVGGCLGGATLDLGWERWAKAGLRSACFALAHVDTNTGLVFAGLIGFVVQAAPPSGGTGAETRLDPLTLANAKGGIGLEARATKVCAAVVVVDGHSGGATECGDQEKGRQHSGSGDR